MRLGHERDAEVAQLVLVALEHPVEGLGRGGPAVLRHGVADLGLRQRPAGVEQADDQVEQALGLGRRRRLGAHGRGRYPTPAAASLRSVIHWRSGNGRTGPGGVGRCGGVRRRASAGDGARHAGAGAGLPGRGRHPRARRPGAAERQRAASGAWAPAAWRSSSPCPTGCRPTRPPGRGTWSRPATPRCSRWSSASTSRRARTTTLLRDADDLAGMPVVVADLHSALPAVLAGLRDRAPGRAGRLRDDRRRRAARWPSPARCRRCATPAGSPRTVTVGQAFGGDLRGGQRRTPACSPRRHVRAARTSPSWPRGRATSAPAPGGASPGASAGEAVNAAATLGGRRGGRRCGCREADARERHQRRVATTASRRTAGWRSRRRTCRCRCCPGRSARGSAPQAAPAGRRQRRPAARGTRWPSTACDEALRASARCGCRRWAAGWTQDRGVVPRGGRRRAARRLPALTRRDARCRRARRRNGPPPTPDGVGTGRSGRAEVALSARRRGRRRRSASRRA